MSSELLKASQVRDYYVQAILESPNKRMNYLSFHAWLRVRGLAPKGGTRKEQQRSVYTAVCQHPDFIKVDPGVFALVKDLPSRGEAPSN